MKRRVLQFIPSFHQGGTERQAVSLTRALAAAGDFDVFAATLNKQGVLLSEFESIRLPDTPEFRLNTFYDRNFLAQVGRCAAYLRENHIDLIHTHDFYSNIFGMAAATLAGTPAKIASKRETTQMRSRLQNAVEKLAFRRANRLIANSRAVRDFLVERGVSADKIEIVYNGTDLSRFSALEPDDRRRVVTSFGLPLDESAVFVTMVANLRHPVKNVPMLLRVALRIAESHPQTHFVVAGEGDLAGPLRMQANGMGVAERVHFVGRCENVPDLLKLSEVGLLTSSAEGFSNSILEYMAAAKPVIATDVGGAAEAIGHGETGFLVEPDDDEQMALHLRSLLDHPDVAIRLGENGRRRIESKFSERVAVERTTALYESCFSANPILTTAIKTC